jgi:BirA family biotin operon repressor/biotin-[acetyl-CoA-carboxylase] ligase
MSDVRWYDSLPSTMTEASRLAALGAPDGTVIVAREQTDGQGRQGRHWLSTPGDGLYCTFILRQAQLPVVTLALGLAVVEALTPWLPTGLDLRWPNDVLWQGQKICGILARLEHGAVLAGIGINLNQTQFPPDLRTPATSLRLATGHTFSPEEVLAALRPAIASAVTLDADSILRLFTQSSSYVAGRRVRIEGEGPILEGITAGLDRSGFLLLQLPNGKLHTVLAGSVRPL